MTNILVIRTTYICGIGLLLRVVYQRAKRGLKKALKKSVHAIKFLPFALVA